MGVLAVMLEDAMEASIQSDMEGKSDILITHPWIINPSGTDHVTRVTWTTLVRFGWSHGGHITTPRNGGHRPCRIRLGGAGPVSEQYQDFSTASGSNLSHSLTPREPDEES